MESVEPIPTVSPQALNSASSAGVSLNSINLRHVTEPRETPSPPVRLRATTFLTPCMRTWLIAQSALYTSSVQRQARNANRPPSRQRRKTLQTNNGEPREGKTEREVDAGDLVAEDDEDEKRKKPTTALLLPAPANCSAGETNLCRGANYPLIEPHVTTVCQRLSVFTQ